MTDAIPSSPTQMSPARARGRYAVLWLWVAVVLAVQAAGWTAAFVIASKQHVPEVPLVPSGAAAKR